MINPNDHADLKLNRKSWVPYGLTIVVSDTAHGS